MKIDLTRAQVNALNYVLQMVLQCYADDEDSGADLSLTDRFRRIAALKECAGVATILTLRETARSFERLAEEFQAQAVAKANEIACGVLTSDSSSDTTATCVEVGYAMNRIAKAAILNAHLECLRSHMIDLARMEEEARREQTGA